MSGEIKNQIVEKNYDQLQQILERLNLLEQSVKHLNEENGRRIKEIKSLESRINLKATKDESSNIKKKNEKTLDNTSIQPNRENKLQEKNIQLSSNSSKDSSTFPHHEEDTPHILIPAKNIIKTIEVLKGRDDCGVEDFINKVKWAKAQCSQPDLLLGIILVEKIKEEAKRAIRFLTIDNYEHLFTVLRQNVNPSVSVEFSRCGLENIRQLPTESVQNYNMRFRRQYKELNYAIRNEHTNSTVRRIVLQIEEKAAIKWYIMNLKEEISTQVWSLRPVTINQAQQEALESEIWFKERNQRRSKLQENLPPTF